MGRARYDQNYNISLIGVSNADGVTPVELWLDPATHQLIVASSAASLPAAPKFGQQAASTSAAALAANALVNGVIIEALTTNTVSVFIGDSSVTVATGFELPPGASTSVAVANTNAVSIISASGTPAVSFLGS